MEKVRLWCGQPSDRGRLKNRTDVVQISATNAVGSQEEFPVHRLVLVLPSHVALHKH